MVLARGGSFGLHDPLGSAGLRKDLLRPLPRRTVRDVDPVDPRGVVPERHERHDVLPPALGRARGAGRAAGGVESSTAEGKEGGEDHPLCG